MQDKDARSAFKLLDADNNGTIPESELRQMLATVGDAMTHQEARCHPTLACPLPAPPSTLALH